MTETPKTIVLNVPEDLSRAYPVMKELRSNIDFDDFQRLVMLAHTADGYRLIAREEHGKIVALMGYRILHDLVHGSHLYVDDLVTTKDKRSQSHGAELLRYAEGECRRLGLTGLRLSTGVDNSEARRFYDREGWTVRSVTYKKKVPSH